MAGVNRVVGQWLLLGLSALVLSAFNSYRFGPLQEPSLITWSLLRNQPHRLFDIRPANDFQVGHLEGAQSLPAAQLAAGLVPGPPLERLVVYTHPGQYSQAIAAARRLRRSTGYPVRVLIDPPL